MKICIVNGCNTKVTNPGAHLFRLPSSESEPNRLIQWLRHLNREDLIGQNVRSKTVCSDHFDPEDINQLSLFRWRLNAGALPLWIDRNIDDLIDEELSTKFPISSPPIEQSSEQSLPSETAESDRLLEEYLYKNETFVWIKSPENDDPSSNKHITYTIENSGKCQKCFCGSCDTLKAKIKDLEEEKNALLTKVDDERNLRIKLEVKVKELDRSDDAKRQQLHRMKAKMAKIRTDEYQKWYQNVDKEDFLRLCKKFMKPKLAEFVTEQMRQQIPSKMESNDKEINENE